MGMLTLKKVVVLALATAVLPYGTIAYGAGQISIAVSGTHEASGDNIEVTGDDTSGYVLNGAGTLNFTSGENAVSTSGTNSHGIFVSALSSNTLNLKNSASLDITVVNTGTSGSSGILSKDVTSNTLSVAPYLLNFKDESVVNIDVTNSALGANKYGWGISIGEQDLPTDNSFKGNMGSMLFTDKAEVNIVTSGDRTGGIYNQNTWNFHTTINGQAELNITTNGNYSAGLYSNNDYNNYNRTHPNHVNVAEAGKLNITTKGNYSHGLVSLNSIFMATDYAEIKVATEGANSNGIVADKGNTASGVNIFADNSTVTVDNSGENSIGILATNGGINSFAGSYITDDIGAPTVVINNTGSASTGMMSDGGTNYIGNSAAVTINSEVDDDSAFQGLYAKNSSTIIMNGYSTTSVNVTGNNGTGLKLENGITDLNDGATLSIETVGNAAVGVAIVGTKTSQLNTAVDTLLDITTNGASSHGLALTGQGSAIKLLGSTKIDIKGTNSNGILVDNGDKVEAGKRVEIAVAANKNNAAIMVDASTTGGTVIADDSYFKVKGDIVSMGGADNVLSIKTKENVANYFQGNLLNDSSSSSTINLEGVDLSWTGDNQVKQGETKVALGAASLWTGDNILDAGTDFITLSDTAGWKGDSLVTSGANTVEMVDNSVWWGNASTTGTGTQNITLKGHAQWEGISTSIGNDTLNVTLEDNSSWYVRGDSSVDTLKMSPGSTVNMINTMASPQSPRTYETLTIANLDGTEGTFKLNTDLDNAVYGSENTYGDKLVIGNISSTGVYYVQVEDESLYTGISIDGERKLLIATNLSNTANLTLVGQQLDQGGLWQINPPTIFQEGNKWYLGYVKKEVNKDTAVSLASRHNVYSLWNRATDTLRSRLGDLRYNEAQAGIWARYYGGHLAGGATQSYHGFQIGMDKTNGHTTYGTAFEEITANDSFTYGYGESNVKSGMLYLTNYSDGGNYLDVVLKYGNINTKYNTTGNYPDRADYDSKGYSASVGYGKTYKLDKGFFVEPQAQLVHSYITGADYRTNRQTIIHEKGLRSLIGRLGVVAGRKLNKTSDYYVKVSWLKEFQGKRDITLAALNGEHMYPQQENYGDSWLEVGLGGNVKLSRKTHFYGDIERTFGAKINKQWQINAGVRFEF